ncbi:MAG: hypothetical protein WDA22_03850 [Bacteroidota bacterium]
MSEIELHKSPFHWKWVGITLLLYILLYYLPLSLVPGGFFTHTIVTTTSIKIIGAWSFAGIFIIAGISAFLAKVNIIIETIIACVCLGILFLVSNQIKFQATLEYNFTVLRELLTGAILVLSIASIGSWFGRQIQKSRRENL